MKASLYRQRDAQCIARDGDVCLLCLFEAKDPSRDPGPIADPTLDHLNDRKGDHALRNLVRLCRAHNTAEGNRSRAGAPRLLTSATLEPLRARAAEIISKRASLNDFQTSTGSRGTGQREGESAEPKAPARWISDIHEENRDQFAARVNFDRMQPEFRLWVYQQVLEHGSITKADAVVSGAAVLQKLTGKGTKKTTLDYFDTITCRMGWLRETRDTTGRLVYEFRKDQDITALGRELEGIAKALRDLLHEGRTP